MAKIAKPYECVRCGSSIAGLGSNSTAENAGKISDYPFCSRKCLLENRVEYEAERKKQGLPPGSYTN